MIHRSDHPTKISHQSKLQRTSDSPIQIPQGQVALSSGDASNPLTPTQLNDHESQRMQCSNRPNCSLLPVTCDPHPAAGTAHPMAFYPHSGRPWSHHPTAGYPYVIASGPSPKTTCPDISRPRRHGLGFNPNGGRSPGHHHLSGWTGCCHFLCSRCGRDSRRFGLAASENKRCQRQQINGYSHIGLLFCRFVLQQRVGFI
jgi:hypothetical protein